MSRKIEDLNPLCQILARRLEKRCEKFISDYLITNTWRSKDDQLENWKKGRKLENGVWVDTDKRQQVTWAMPGYSWHEYGLAWDGYPIINGKLADIKKDLSAWEIVWREARNLGIECGADWKKFDGPHFQFIGRYTPKDFPSLISKKKKISTNELLEDYTNEMLKDNIKAIQIGLNFLGYDCGNADGKAGKKTADQIALFLFDNNLIMFTGKDLTKKIFSTVTSLIHNK